MDSEEIFQKEELQTKTEERLSLIAELEQERTQIKHLHRELEEARSQATIAHCTAENAVEIEKRKCEEEIATLQQLMKEELSIARSKISGLQDQLAIYDAEIHRYRSLYEQRIEDSDHKRTDGLVSTSVLSDVTRSIAKKVNSLSPAHSSITTPEKSPTSLQMPHQAGSGATATSAGAEKAENLEDSMKRAQEDAALLRSLLVPLEEEIAALKDKIREQDAQLRARESQEQFAIKTSDILGPLFQGKSSEELVQELDEKLQGVKNTLKVEKDTRADLELYTAILNTQKTALLDNVDRLRKQLNETRRMYDEERKAHNDLRYTWQKANDQFLETQTQNLSHMRHIRSVLNPDQLKMLYDLQHVNKDIASPLWEKPNAAKEDSVRSGSTFEEGRGMVTSSNDGNKVEKGFVYIEPHSLEKKEPSLSQEDLERVSSDDTTSPAPLDPGEGLESEKDSSNEDYIFKNSTESLASKISFFKVQLTDDQKKALYEADAVPLPPIEGEQKTLPLVEIDSPSKNRVVSETEWIKLQEELKRSRVFAVCQLCIGFESQLKKVENVLRESEKEKSIFKKAVERQKEELERESQYRKSMEHKWKQLGEEISIKEKNLQGMTDKINQSHLRFMSKFNQDKLHLQESFKNLSLRHESIQKELLRLQKENDDLVGKHSQHSDEMQNEIINLPDSMEEMQLLLLKFREDVIAAKVAKENIEDKLKSEILFLKNQVLGEQYEKSSMESRLMGELEQMRSSAGMMESLQEDLSSEKDLKTQAESRVQELERKLQESIKRSQQFITALKKEIEDQKQTKKMQDTTVADFKNRIGTLQQNMETSEAVQRDFVRLSQSLQVDLEKIRQSDKEVRWQHEEDIDECNNCNQRFSTAGRRKHHCRHCGKVFCSDCIMKTVTSGPHNRTSKVCDVCHTLLVQDAVPYFVTDHPQPLD